ncbi:MAG: hypothetical protein HC849_02150 [Oscillatoriales cyanobacterium RU_3_3]|nr:hypothetical protein [Oscillatoriales cyanobacterium RU_3_3]
MIKVARVDVCQFDRLCIFSTLAFSNFTQAASVGSKGNSRSTPSRVPSKSPSQYRARLRQKLF